MVLLTNIHPVSDFTRNTKKYFHRLKKTGRAEVLTIDGEGEIVIQSIEAYQKFLDAVELAETLPILRKSLGEAKRGEGRPAREVLKEIAASVGLELK
jgi:uncharacterized pyridoxamine 5'-phosphate oxidase family protein